MWGCVHVFVLYFFISTSTGSVWQTFSIITILYFDASSLLSSGLFSVTILLLTYHFDKLSVTNIIYFDGLSLLCKGLFSVTILLLSYHFDASSLLNTGLLTVTNLFLSYHFDASSLLNTGLFSVTYFFNYNSSIFWCLVFTQHRLIQCDKLISINSIYFGKLSVTLYIH